jgi:RNA polymerase sigma-70 factor (ECF subfamily)
MHLAAMDFPTVPEPPRAASSASADDRRLAAGCAAGDTATFEELYRRFGDRMKSIAWQHLGSRSDAEDAVQETFLKVHRAAKGFTGEAAFSTWLYRILINTCYDALRRRRRRPEESMTLRKLLAALPEQRRNVFMLFEVEGLSHAEIAAILGISEGNSKWILFSTKKQLQEQWKQAR